MITRAANTNDFPALYTLWQNAGLQLYPEADEQKRYGEMLSLNPDLCLVLLNDDGQIVGSILGAFDGRTASIHRLAISPELQKKGLGKELVAALEMALKNRGIKKLAAQIHISNTQVLPFYEKLGFQEMTYVRTFFKDISE